MVFDRTRSCLRVRFDRRSQQSQPLYPGRRTRQLPRS